MDKCVDASEEEPKDVASCDSSNGHPTFLWFRAAEM